MGSDVDQGTAALFGFIREYAPGGNTAATDRTGFGIIDFTQFAIVADRFQRQAVLAAAVLISDGQDLAASLLRIQHLLSIGRSCSHGFFTEDILAGIQRSNRQFTV